MTEVKMLKPINNAVIRDPISKIPLDQNGETKELTSFWKRRINDGSCQIVEKIEQRFEKKGGRLNDLIQ